MAFIILYFIRAGSLFWFP